MPLDTSDLTELVKGYVQPRERESFREQGCCEKEARERDGAEKGVGGRVS
jgi:hypothetical protein